MAVDTQGNEVGKLFVGGLHQSTTNDTLRAYFNKFGEIEECIVMMDNRTGRSRGFGYVKFKEPVAVDNVLSEKSHIVDTKEVDPKKCNVNMRGRNRRSLKVFVGGISFEHDEETIRNCFQSFGKVTDVNLLPSPNRQRHRGFAFVGFDDEEVVKNLIRMHYVNLNGKQVEVKAMEPPNMQRGSGLIPGGPMPFGQSNGRAVRGGGRMTFNHLPASDPTYGNWSQWPANVVNGSWNPPSGHLQHSGSPAQPWSPHMWNGAGTASNGQQHNGAGAAGGPPPGPTNGALGWGNQNSMSANGWPPAWGPHAGAPCNNNRRLTGGPPSGPGDPLNSHPMDSWSQSAVATAAMCQFGPQHLPQQLAAGSGHAGGWTQSGGSMSSQWGAPNTMSARAPGGNSASGGMSNIGPPGGNGGWGDNVQNGATMAALAMAAACANPAAHHPMSHWGETNNGPAVPGAGLKFEDTLYASQSAAAAYGMASAATSNSSGVANDWRTSAVDAASVMQGAYQPQPNLYKR